MIHAGPTLCLAGHDRARRERRGCCRASAGLTLIELVVVVAIIGLLMAVLLPAIQNSRASAHRMSCQNNLRQLGIALHSFESATGHLPNGAQAHEYPTVPGHPHTFYRWSALAELTPYLELGTVRQGLDLTQPLYGPDLRVTKTNQQAVAQVIPLFLCPSDRGEPVAVGFGPSNYATCTGSGVDGGSPFESDGLFYINSKTRLCGTSKTASRRRLP